MKNLQDLANLVSLREEINHICQAHGFTEVSVYYREDLGYDEDEDVTELKEPVRLFIHDERCPYTSTNINRTTGNILLQRQNSLEQALEKQFSCDFDLTFTKLPKTFSQGKLTDLDEGEAKRIFLLSDHLRLESVSFAQNNVDSQANHKKCKIEVANGQSHGMLLGKQVNLYQPTQGEKPILLDSSPNLYSH